MRRVICFLLLFAALAAFQEARQSPPPVQAAAPSRVCEAPLYAGILHCIHQLRGSLVHVVSVNLSDPRISFKLAMPRSGPEPDAPECDNTRTCGEGFYPFESVPGMLARHAPDGAVVGINTDYFGMSRRPDHGAESIAVRDGVRLDDFNNSELVGRTSLAISRANQASLLWVGARNTPLDLQGLHYTVAGGGPQIIHEGQSLDNQACPVERLHVAVCAREYEAAAALTRTHLVLAVARNMDTAGLAAFLTEQYSAISGIKFDGGGSAQLAWVDAGGAVTGFDASNATNDGFRRVAQGLMVYSRPLTRWPTASLPGTMLDESGAQFTYTTTLNNWHTVGEADGWGGTFGWTPNSKLARNASIGQWNVRAGTRGVFQVYAHIPEWHATTRSALYEVGHAGGISQVVADQLAARGTWILLGEYRFNGDGHEFVRLTSATGEPFGATEVAFDAIGLIKIG